MIKVLVSTTIQAPTEAIRKFDALKGWTLIVAGDLKTPPGYKLKNGIYLSPKDQEKIDKKLSDLIGWNNHGRRNMANLVAKELNADVIGVVDDDNIPFDDWGKNLIVGTRAKVNYYQTKLDAFDPVGATNYPQLWHRGFPIQLVPKREYSKKAAKTIFVDIQADFWDGDPDIDAICRMTLAPRCKFNKKYFPIASNKPSPFNSQNIIVHKNALKDYFVLPHITPYGRMSDIWIAYHMCALGYKVAFAKPSVYQDRNQHDLMVDMKDEMIGYEKNLSMVKDICRKTYDPKNYWPKRTLQAYEAYRKHFK